MVIRPRDESALRRRPGPVALVALVALFAGLLSVVPMTAGPVAPAAAASPSGFNPGFIISDAYFYDGDAMTAPEIQSFLDTKVSSCARGYTCLRSYSQGVPAMAANSYCGAVPGGTASAAQLIAEVGQACSVSQKALLVLLEKEQGLVTSTAPSDARYRAATGMGCPDTAPCDPQVAGFFYQVYYAARQFQIYRANPGSFNFSAGQNASILYSPNGDVCGRRTVYLQNDATAGLYDYTPYTPNAAALANLYGTGDGCSSYGNRNFWRIYTDWFGSTTQSPWASVDSVTARWGGVHISGWARDRSASVSPTYVWVNIDGVGGPISTNVALNWFPSYFPGYGVNHGFDAVIPARPGGHQVCTYIASTSELIQCDYVTVPLGAGSFDAVSAVPGGARVTGWSVDAAATGPSYLWINVDGKGSAYKTNTALSWLPRMYPGAAVGQGFDLVVPAPPGAHQVCVYGVWNGASTLLGCKTATLPIGYGSLDAVTVPRAGTIEAKGWFVDYTSSAPASSYVLSINGVDSPQVTDKDLSWIPSLYPGVGTRRGFDVTVKAPPGTDTVCVRSVSTKLTVGCKTVVVPSSVVTSVDTIAPVPGGVRLTGWSVDTDDLVAKTPMSISVDGVTKSTVPAGETLSWFNGLYPGAGTGHGFDTTVATGRGVHTICVSAASVRVTCRTVDVPSSFVSSIDSISPVPGGVAISGWSIDLSNPTATAFLWVNVDGAGGPVRADKPLSWFNGLYPGAGPAHGLAATVIASAGTHRVCVFADGLQLTCATVAVR